MCHHLWCVYVGISILQIMGSLLNMLFSFFSACVLSYLSLSVTSKTSSFNSIHSKK